ncbi:MAG: hypothetical protein FJ044_03315 [Candidatus Cloacimonetes bacterium]|nr:hypothetical protein [Candidatus Cloacimonadota bacterium]
MNKEEYQKEAARLAKLRERALKIASDFAELVDRRIVAKKMKELLQNKGSSTPI